MNEFLEINHSPVFYLKLKSSGSGICLSPQVKAYLGSMKWSPAPTEDRIIHAVDIHMYRISCLVLMPMFRDMNLYIVSYFGASVRR
jgi:hypothetical protein